MSARHAEIATVLREVEKQGAQVSRSGSGHWKIFNPDTGRSICIPATPGDRRFLLNIATRLRRIGLSISSVGKRGTSRRPRRGYAHAR